jgi:hypothetical protein
MPVPCYSEEGAREKSRRPVSHEAQPNTAQRAARDQHVTGNSGSLAKSGEQARHKLAQSSMATNDRAYLGPIIEVLSNGVQFKVLDPTIIRHVSA